MQVEDQKLEALCLGLARGYWSEVLGGLKAYTEFGLKLVKEVCRLRLRNPSSGPTAYARLFFHQLNSRVTVFPISSSRLQVFRD